MSYVSFFHVGKRTRVSIRSGDRGLQATFSPTVYWSRDLYIRGPCSPRLGSDMMQDTIHLDEHVHWNFHFGQRCRNRTLRRYWTMRSGTVSFTRVAVTYDLVTSSWLDLVAHPCPLSTKTASRTWRQWLKGRLDCSASVFHWFFELWSLNLVICTTQREAVASVDTFRGCVQIIRKSKPRLFCLENVPTIDAENNEFPGWTIQKILRNDLICSYLNII